MVNSRQKGALGENKAIELLSKYAPNIQFKRTPGSGSGTIKGDIYYDRAALCIEVKNYAEDSLSTGILNKKDNISLWWPKLLKECKGKKPLLLYKWNRSKWYAVVSEKPTHLDNYVYISHLNCYIMLAEEWLSKEEIKW